MRIKAIILGVLGISILQAASGGSSASLVGAEGGASSSGRSVSPAFRPRPVSPIRPLTSAEAHHDRSSTPPRQVVRVDTTKVPKAPDSTNPEAGRASRIRVVDLPN